MRSTSPLTQDQAAEVSFNENCDFTVFVEKNENRNGGRPAKEYAIIVLEFERRAIERRLVEERSAAIEEVLTIAGLD